MVEGEDRKTERQKDRKMVDRKIGGRKMVGQKDRKRGNAEALLVVWYFPVLHFLVVPFRSLPTR